MKFLSEFYHTVEKSHQTRLPIMSILSIFIVIKLNNNEILSKEKQKVSDELKLREGEINKLKQQISRNNKMREAIQRKLQLSEEVCIKYKQFYTRG